MQLAAGLGGGAGKRVWMGLNGWKARHGGGLGCWVIGGYDGRALSIISNLSRDDALLQCSERPELCTSTLQYS